VLTIRGEKKEEHEEKEKRYHLWERRYGSFERSFTLPRSVDPQGIKARFEDGVLKIDMPKSRQARGQRIDVEGEQAVAPLCDIRGFVSRVGRGAYRSTRGDAR